MNTSGFEETPLGSRRQLTGHRHEQAWAYLDPSATVCSLPPPADSPALSGL